MKVRTTLTGFLILGVAFVALERGHLRRSSRTVASREAAKPPPLPPARPDADAAPPAVAALTPASFEPPSSAVAPPPARMTASQEAAFDAWMIRTYLHCWKPAAEPADGDAYVAQVRLAFKPDGSLKKAPKLVNPPSNPASRPQAKSAMEAVKACNPLPIPAQYRPFYEQWKTKTIHFNPVVAAR